MTMSFLLIVLLAAWLAAWRRRYRWSLIFLVVGVAGFFLVGSGVLPRWLMGQLQGPYTLRPAQVWAPRNVVVLLTGGQVRVPPGTLEPSLGSYGRIAQVAMMYHDCRGAKVLCTVLVSGGDPDGYGTSLAVVYGGLLQRMGVPAQDLLLEPRSANTWQNAKFTQPMLHAVSPARVWLVTSGFHMRRALAYFARFGIVPIPTRADYIQIVPQWTPSAINFAMMDLGLHEYVGLLRFRVYDAMGWNERIAGSVAP